MQIKQTSIFHHRYSQQTILIATFAVRLDERNEHSQGPQNTEPLKLIMDQESVLRIRIFLHKPCDYSNFSYSKGNDGSRIHSPLRSQSLNRHFNGACG